MTVKVINYGSAPIIGVAFIQIIADRLGAVSKVVKDIIKKIIYRIRGEYTIDSLKKLGLKVGENFNPQLGFELDPSHCWLIKIGDNVTFGPHVQVLAHDASTCHYLGYAKIGRVTIGNNCFIGAGSIVLPNTTIGNNTIIGAGSVVTHSIPDNCVAAGNPAKVIMSLDEYLNKHREQMKTGYLYDESYTLRKGIPGTLKEKQYRELEFKQGYVR